MIRSYRDLRVWASAFELVTRTYALTRRLPSDERFGLTGQMRRAAVSVAANIAEGKGRYSLGEYVHHLSIASGSLSELETHELIARELGFLPDVDARELLRRIGETGAMLTRLTQRLRTRRQEQAIGQMQPSSGARARSREPDT